MKIEIKDLKKFYGEICVLDVDHLIIKDGAVTALVGPNGAGKSTLLNIIGDLLSKDHGTILYEGQKTVPLQTMTLVFQEPYLISSNVRKNIAYPMKIRKMPQDEMDARVQVLARELKLEPLLNKKVNQLSLGEVQKVALARALAFEPKLLLLDEPCASIDPYTTSEIEKLLLKMNREKKTTVVIVTHNLAQARRLADEVVLLNRGRVLESGTSVSFFENPVHKETRKFIKGELLI